MTDLDFPLPEVHCPFPESFTTSWHKDTEHVSRVVADTLRCFGDDDEQTLADVRLVDSAGRFYPESDVDGLEAVVWYFAVFFTQDDWLGREHSAGKLPATDVLRRVYDRALEVLDGAPPGVPDPAFVRLLAPLGRRLRSSAPPAVAERFRRSFVRYLNAQIWESDHVRRGSVADLAVYPFLRRQSSGIWPVLDLHPWLFGLSLSAATLDHAVVRQLNTMTANCAVWANDLLSLRKELDEGSVTNIVLSLRQHHGCGMREAADAAAQLLRDETDAYLRLKERLPHLGLGSELPALLALFDRQERWLADDIVWHTVARYERSGASDA